jgi:integrase/recombinase XerD
VIVQRVVTSGLEAESWTVLGEDGWPVGPIERFLPGHQEEAAADAS